MASSETDAFAVKLGSVVNGSLTAMNLIIGQSTGLLDVMAEFTNERNAKTSPQIAKEADLKERYVRKWLIAMVVGDIIDCDSSGTKFWLLKSRAPILRSDNPRSPLLMASFIPCLGTVTDKLIECFRVEGPSGLSYDNYTQFHSRMALVSNFMFRHRLVPSILPKVDGLVQNLSTGLRCLDVGCGVGTASQVLAEQFPTSHFTGIDCSADAIHEAKEQSSHLTNVHFECQDAALLKQGWADRFELVTAFDSIHDQAHPDRVLAQCFRVTKPGGRFLVMDINGTGNCLRDKKLPFSNFGYTASLFHCMPVSLFFEDGMGWGAMWGKVKATKMLKDAGFVMENTFPIGMENVMYVCSKSVACQKASL